MGNMPLLVRILIMALWLSVIPVVGGGFQRVLTGEKNTGRDLAGRLVFGWVSGQILLWAVFQLICAPCVLWEVTFDKVVLFFGVATAALAAGAVVMMAAGRGKSRPAPVRKVFGQDRDRVRLCLWICFFALLGLQMVQAVRLAYADGDDAYYVAVSSITENAGTLYQKMPYTRGFTDVDIRHGLAPFPVWIAFLTRVSGIPAVSAAHIAVPLMLIPMTYGIFYLLGKRIFAGK